MENANVIYVAYCDKSDEFYIGRTCHPAERFKQHISDNQSPVHERAEMYGRNHIFFFIIKANLSKEEAAQYEAKYIYEKYAQVKLINRSLPPSQYLTPFCKTEEQTEHFKKLAYKIEKDMTNGIGCFAEAKARRVRGNGNYIRCGTTPYQALKIALGEKNA